MSDVVIKVGDRHIRRINEEIQVACAAGQRIGRLPLNLLVL